MPQLIAMIIVVVGAMVYMFQTFGGAGETIQNVAKKGSVITEINNIKTEIMIAQKSNDLVVGDTLLSLANRGYFDSEIRNQITESNANIYSAISFGAGDDMRITLETVSGEKPIISVSFEGMEGDGAPGFFESQVNADISSVSVKKNATISFTGDPTVYETETDGSYKLDTEGNKIVKAASTLKSTLDYSAAATGTDNDGMFTIQYDDLKEL